MKLAEYRVFPFPERGYTLDAVVQERLTTRSVRGGRMMAFLFLGLFLAFVVGVLGGLLGFPQVAVGVIPLGFLLPAAVLLHLRTPHCLCSSCRQAMKKTWAAIESTTGRQGLFVVCDACRALRLHPQDGAAVTGELNVLARRPRAAKIGC